MVGIRGITAGAVALVVIAACTSSTESTVAPAPGSEATEPASVSTTTVVVTATSKDASTTSTTATTTTAATADDSPAAPEWESVFEAGMECRDFVEMDLGYEAALGYWFVQGRPQYMDADGDDIPCEEEAFTAWLPIVGDGADAQYPHGLYCRDIVSDPWVSPRAAFLYWLIEGSPDRMDADHDGIPCETVFPEIVLRGFLEDPYLLDDGTPAGLTCEDLRWVRPYYRQSVAYFFAEGSPDRLDPDGNGVPCEGAGYEDEPWDLEWVQAVESGMSCDELADSEHFAHDYFGLVFYWMLNGRPPELDSDNDGLPCHPGWGDAWSLEDIKWFTDGLPGYTNAC